MSVSHEDTVMYARFLLARYGARALHAARKRAQKLEVRGDLEGCKVWNSVVIEVQRRAGHNARGSRAGS